MSRRRAERSRSDITGQIDQNQGQITEQEEVLGETVDDIDTVRGTIESFNLGGTLEGAEAVEEAIRQAESGTVDLYESQDGELESLHDEVELIESELSEQVDAVEADLDGIHEAEGRLETSVARDGLEQAEASAEEDRSFLEEQEQRAHAAQEASRQAQQEFRRRAHGR